MRSDTQVRFESGVISSTNHNSLLRIVTNEITSLCKDNKLCQMAFFVIICQSGQRRGKGQLSCYVEIFDIKIRLFVII